ncbi:MAG: hypothetical protein ABIJ96_07445 [Elusimicrobiota bacterium]
MDEKDVEVVTSTTGRSEDERERAAFFAHHAVTPGALGKAIAGLTVLAAALVIAALLFGKILLLSAAAALLWPMIFSAEFTRWVFGSATVPFWKILLMFTFIGFAMRWVRGWMRE